jgi:hypothetical protein
MLITVQNWPHRPDGALRILPNPQLLLLSSGTNMSENERGSQQTVRVVQTWKTLGNAAQLR